jgi:hypothetical protein
MDSTVRTKAFSRWYGRAAKSRRACVRLRNGVHSVKAGAAAVANELQFLVLCAFASPSKRRNRPR